MISKKSLVAVGSIEQREHIIMIALEQRPASLSKRQACDQLGIARSSFRLEEQKQLCFVARPGHLPLRVNTVLNRVH